MVRVTSKIFAFSSVLVLAACGGDDSGTTTTPTTPETPSTPSTPSTPTLTVDAGSDQTAEENTTVSLAATTSDGFTNATVLWEQTAGPSVSLTQPESLTTDFTAPDVTETTTLTFTVTVTDGGGTAVSDQISVSITDVPVTTVSLCESYLPAFQNLKADVTATCDNDTLGIYNETGLPPTSGVDADDKIMVGITAWIQRAPVPYTFDWKIPLATEALGTVTEATAKGPIGVAIDGVPIFHYERRPDVSTALSNYTAENDTVLVGELDQCGGHSGQGDDYHYHYAPVCLLDGHDLAKPIAFGLDGVPVYFGEGGDDYYGRGRYSDISNLPSIQLDDCNAILNADGLYEHYTTKTPPYVIGCHHGVFSTSTQIEPRPMSNRSQGTTSPFTGSFGEPATTVITDFEQKEDGSYQLEFNSLTSPGTTSALIYTVDPSDPACWSFEYRTDKDVAGTTQTACRSDFVAPKAQGKMLLEHPHEH